MIRSEDSKGLLSLPRRAARRAYLQLRVERLKAANRHGTFRITAPGGPVVSLTSFGKRIDSVYLAIESIARGSTLPSELILWLDDETRYNSLPSTLERLARRGLTIKLSKNYGPHTKYYPYISSQHEFSLPLVTADDDIIYPRDWLHNLTGPLSAIPALSAVTAHELSNSARAAWGLTASGRSATRRSPVFEISYSVSRA